MGHQIQFFFFFNTRQRGLNTSVTIGTVILLLLFHSSDLKALLYKEWCAKRTSIDMPSFEPYFHENSSKLSSHVRKRLRRQMFAQQIYKTTHWSYVKKQIKKEKLWSYLQTWFWCFVKPWSKVILGEISKTLNFLSESYFIFMQHQHESFAFWYGWRESSRSLNSGKIINAVT